MKVKYIALLIALIMLLGAFAGCDAVQEKPAPQADATEAADATDTEASDKPQVIATIFPQYDFLRAIGGDKIDLKMLLAPGAESHSFEPTPKEMIAIADADLFVYVGGHADEWVDDILKTRGDDKLTLALVDMVDTVDEELVEGMEPEHDHDHEHEHEEADEDHEHEHEEGEEAHDHEHEHEHEHELDEHVWTDPQNAVKIVRQLSDALGKIDPENKTYYDQNAAEYIEKLQALDQKFAELVDKAHRKTIVVGDRFPLRYFVDRYGLTYYAAFPGCSAENDASPQTIAFLVDKVKEEKIPVVFHIELSNQQIANSIAEATGAKVLEFHSLHNISPDDFAAGKTYVDIMEQNYENLRQALEQ